MANTITPDLLLAQMRALAAQAQGNTAHPAQGAENQTGFDDLLKKSIATVNDTQQEAAKLRQAFELGDKKVQMSEVMVAVQKASVSFQTMLQVRNKLVSAYQEIMNMQV